MGFESVQAQFFFQALYIIAMILHVFTSSFEVQTYDLRLIHSQFKRQPYGLCSMTQLVEVLVDGMVFISEYTPWYLLC